MKSDFVNLLGQYKKEIFVAVVTAIAALLFTKAVPAFLSFLREAGAYVLAILTGRRAEHRFEQKYLTWLVNENKFLVNVPSQLLTPAHLPKQPELESVFIKLHLKRSNEAPVELAISELVKPGAKTVILGDPGSGKTTQLKFLCLIYARLSKTPIFQYRKRRRLTSKIQATGNRIPILIYLSRLTESDSNLLSAAERLLPESLSAIYPQGYFQRILEDGKCIMLLDGLDEVPTNSLRKRIAETIGSLSNATNERNSWIASSRIVGYTTQLHNSFETAIVKDLTSGQVKQFIENWYRFKCETSRFSEAELPNQREIHSQRAKNLINTIRLNPGLASLTTSPILVSLIALLHSVKIELPQSRPLLYRDCVELLADRWDLTRGLGLNAKNPILLEQKMEALMSIASHLHNHRLREVRRAELGTIVSSKLKILFQSASHILPGRIIDDLEERSGLLINRGLTEAGEKIIAFSHLSFQEYLTARSLLSNANSNAKEMLSDHFADSWWREAILLYVAQMESPRALIEQIYDDSFEDKSVEKLLLAAACLSEVKLEKTGDLYTKIFGEVAFIYSCGETSPQPSLSPLECDKNNMLLRYMVDYLLRTTEQQRKGIEMLLKMKRDIEPDSELVDEFVREYEAATDVLDYDLRMLKAISKHRRLPTEPVLSVVFRVIDKFDRPEEILLREPITTHQLATAALVQSDWRRIVNRIVSLSPHAVVDVENPKPEGWKQSSVVRLILKHQTHSDDSQDDRSSDSVETINECLSLIAERDYPHAEETYRRIRSWIKPEVARECEQEIERVYNSTDAAGRRFCVMLILRVKQVDDRCAELLIDFVTRTLNSISQAELYDGQKKSQARINQFQDVTLLKRAISSLSNYRFRTHRHVRFLLQCFESNSPDVVDFAVSSIERLEEVSNDSVNTCNELLNSLEPAKLWAGILLSSSAKAAESSFIEKMLPQLYDKDVMFRSKSLADHAAYSILKVLSNNPSTPVVD